MHSSRYLRQTLLQEIGEKGQEALQNARILIVGMGGLGSPAALYLTAAGLGHIGLIDEDQVDESNLQRQILYKTADTGRRKVDAALENLQALNPEPQITALPYFLNSENVLDVFSSYDLIIDGTDNFSTKFLINDAAFYLGKPVVFGTVSQWEGRVTVFDPRIGPCYRCLYPAPPKVSTLGCAEGGIVGAVAGILGCVQATEAIKWLLLRSSISTPTSLSTSPQALTTVKSSLTSLSGRLWVLDCASMETSTFAIKKRSDCPTCSVPIEKSLIWQNLKAGKASSISARELERQGLNNFYLLDVREKEEWAQGHLPGAQNLPLSEMKTQKPPPCQVQGKPLVIYCQRGSRSLEAIQTLSHWGWKNLFNLEGGILAWNSATVDSYRLERAATRSE